MFTKYEVCTPFNAKVTKVSFQKQVGQTMCQGVCQILFPAIQVKLPLYCLFRVLLNLSCLPPERVELTVNSKKETNGRVKMGKGQDGLLLFTP